MPGQLRRLLRSHAVAFKCDCSYVAGSLSLPVLQEDHRERVPPAALELSGRLGSPPMWAVLFPHTGAILAW